MGRDRVRERERSEWREGEEKDERERGREIVLPQTFEDGDEFSEQFL